MEAKDQFRAFVKRVGGTDKAAEQLKCNRSYVSLLQTGGRLPSLKLAARIEAISGIPAASWIPAGDAVEPDAAA